MYRPNAMGMRVVFEPEKAKRELVAAFRKHRTCGAAAASFDVSLRQFNRWIRTLGLENELDRIRKGRAS